MNERAGGRCEYCRILESDTFYGCQIDHIIAEKHHGVTVESNLALTCAYCNRYKGTDIGSIAKSTGQYVRFFNPRTDHWFEHFRFVRFEILPLTPIGETTSTILRFNDPDRVFEREAIGET
ncbi:MAG: HNH endonuclease [Pirellula sp.]